MNTNNRIASLDVLRVLSMFFVVVSHYIYHGIKSRPDLQEYYTVNTVLGGGNFISLEALYIISCVAVNCFVMISGFFLIEKTCYRWKGVLNVWTETFFYSVTFLIVSFIWGGSISSKEVLHSVLPIWGQQYWFMTFYLGLMLLAPIIARATASLNEKQYRIVLIILFVLNFQYLYGGVYGGFASLMWFSFLFMAGGYFKRFGCQEWVKRHKGSLLLVIWSGLTLMALGMNVVKGGNTSLVSTSYHGPVFFLSLVFFIYFAFTEMKRKIVDWISKMAPYTLAVYLIHANGFWKGRIWEAVIPDSFSMPIVIYCVGSCFLIFIVCVIIDMLRALLFKLMKIDNLVGIISAKLPQL